MTKAEKIIVAEIKSKFPETDWEDTEIVRWAHTLNGYFEQLAPIDYKDKFGGKRWKNKLKKMVDF